MALLSWAFGQGLLFLADASLASREGKTWIRGGYRFKSF